MTCPVCSGPYSGPFGNHQPWCNATQERLMDIYMAYVDIHGVKHWRSLGKIEATEGYGRTLEKERKGFIAYVGH